MRNGGGAAGHKGLSTSLLCVGVRGLSDVLEGGVSIKEFDLVVSGSSIFVFVVNGKGKEKRPNLYYYCRGISRSSSSSSFIQLV